MATIRITITRNYKSRIVLKTAQLVRHQINIQTYLLNGVYEVNTVANASVCEKWFNVHYPP